MDDLKDDDAEMLEIYVGRGRNVPGVAITSTRSGSSGAPVPVPNVVIVDDDAESGNGPSLPMSPHSVEGAIGGPLYDRSFRFVRLIVILLYSTVVLKVFIFQFFLFSIL